MPFPSTDFNFVVASIATFAATVGYAYTRRLSTSASSTTTNDIRLQRDITAETNTDMNEFAMDVDHEHDQPSPVITMDKGSSAALTALTVESLSDFDQVHQMRASPPSLLHIVAPVLPSVPTVTRRDSRKRKVPHDGFDEPSQTPREPLGYPYNLANIYPNKRSRTPSSHSVASDLEVSTTASTLDIIYHTPESIDEDVKIPLVEVHEENHSSPVGLPPTILHGLSAPDTSAMTPATEPPLSPSPVPEVEGDTQAMLALSPPAPKSPSPAEDTILPSNLPITSLAPALALESVPAISEKSDSPEPVAPKPLTHPAFGITSAPTPFPLSMPSTPSFSTNPQQTTTTTSNPFAAFVGPASPFAVKSALGRGGSSFGSSSSFGSTSSFSASFSSAGGSFGKNLISNRDVFSVTPVWSKKVKAPTASQDPQESVRNRSPEQKADTAEDGEVKDEPATVDAKGEREARGAGEAQEQEEKEARERRAREEAEILEEETREKRARKERKLRERAAGHALFEAPVVAESKGEKYTPMTGEEEEDVEAEQRGVRLFVKRGTRPYSEGISGHIKLLSNRTTLEERILFRREPLWKVSMNVRVQPSVRATFVAGENGDVLRFILTEPVQTDDEDPAGSGVGAAKHEIVIYVVKPGRTCSKQDFGQFAEDLMKIAQFKQAQSNPDGSNAQEA